MTTHPPIDHHSIGLSLSAAGAPWEASEAHGACCGWVCLGGASAILAWSKELLGPSEADDALAQERQQQLHQLAANALLHLEKGEMEFAPLLPPDESLLDERTIGLAEWSQGFMNGLAMGAKSGSDAFKQALDNGVTKEILDDFSQITRAAVENDDDEASEQAYMELVEYVRISAQIIYDELTQLRNQAKESA